MGQPAYNRVFNVLFLCTGNSARSIMSEGLLNVFGQGRFHAYSAGTSPAEQISPFAIELLQGIGYNTSRLRPKSWQEFEGPNAPHMDIVITVCDQARGEACPAWPGHPVTAHWAYEDPHGTTDEELRASFSKIFTQIKRRVDLLISLPTEKLEHLSLNDAAVQDIGKTA